MILALVVRPGQEPEVATVVETLPSFQAIVGGYIEAVRLDSRTILYCNEDGIAKNLPINCLVGGHAIRGTFFLVGFDGSGEECSLKPEQVREWGEKIRAAKVMWAERKEMLQ